MTKTRATIDDALFFTLISYRLYAFRFVSFRLEGRDVQRFEFVGNVTKDTLGSIFLPSYPPLPSSTLRLSFAS